MRVLKHIKDEGIVKVIPDSTEDLWHIERVLLPGDLVSAKSWRRFKASDRESGEKKEIFVQVRAEQAEFSEHANRVRVTGKIVAGGPEEFIQVGSYHTIDVEPHFPVEIKKQGGWMGYELDRLYNAQKAAKRVRLGVVVLDEQKALFASIKEFGVSFDFEIESRASKRDKGGDEKRKQYLGDVAKAVSDLKAGKIIIAGPGFTKDGLKKLISEKHPELAKKITYEGVSNAEQSGVYELMKRGIIEKVAGEERTATEFALMEEASIRIAKDSGLVAYGRKEVADAVSANAVDRIMITDELLRKDKEIEDLLGSAERSRCAITVFNSKSQPGEQLAGLGGIAALLRFRTQ